MITRHATSLAAAFAAALSCLAIISPVPAAAAPTPVWDLSATSQPTNFTAGSSGEDRFLLVATNIGAKATSAEITITDTLPAGLTPAPGTALAPGTEVRSTDPNTAAFNCTTLAQTITCKGPGPVHPGFILMASFSVNVTAPEGSVLPANEAEISGGGALSAKASTVTTISAASPPFGFMPVEEGFRAPLIAEDGTPATQAGSHPYGGVVDINFPTVQPGGFLTSSGHPRDISLDLPPGLLANPAATPTRCTEAELASENSPGCPPSSQIGTVTITTFVLTAAPEPTALYNMVPPPGAPASFGFDALGVGIFPHVIGSIRTESDYGATGSAHDILARGLNPILSVSTQLWGDPSSKAHDFARECPGGGIPGEKACEEEERQSSLLSLPGSCSQQPLAFGVNADSWEEPGLFHSSSYQSADLQGSPVALGGCNKLEFKPTISVTPTTNLTDSPSGLDVDLHQPQDFNLDSLTTAQLKDAVVTLPAGMSVNPSQADGLAACTPAQIGLLTAVGQAAAHFSAKPSSCPDASTLGTVEATSPLLAQYSPDGTELQTDPETGDPIPQPLHGSVYLAEPFDNPFNSLLAIYLTVEDPQTGIFAKLAGRIEPDPVSGQLTTRFAENPQLPIEDVRLHLFGGARGALITPPVCGAHTTTTDLTPWSTPEGADAHPESTFQTTAAPGGGACPSAEGQAANAPAFAAGTISPQAGTYSPFVLKLSREDGSQHLGGIEATLPPGLAAKFAGVPYCSEAQIAQAQTRSHPNEGILERQSPSCPAASELGTVNVGAGAGPSPFYTTGHAYLAGPYKGAPLSMAIITPAIAGPFDLGTVVVRTALYVNPVTAQGRAVSDPLPQILDGIPLDIRSVAVSLDRPDFTLNPTSCDRMAIAGAATSTLGALAPLSTPFQVGGCPALKFKPKLAIKLSGGTKRSKNPALKATLTMAPGGANIAKASVALPHSEFLDQSHIRTVCTRVQFAEAGGNGAGCPAGSVYGRARALTPLLAAPLEGPVFLRSNPEHELPDLVAALQGQIPVDLIGRVDSVNGGIRTTFEGAPDAPVTKFVLEMQGGKKGLLENSVNLCKTTNRATALFDGQNGKVFDFKPVVGNSCKKKEKKHKSHGGK
jgi:uncharacterized repeat protein (TIGR01451 family)